MWQFLHTFLSAFVLSRFGAVALLAVAAIAGFKLWLWFNDGLRKCR